MVARKKLLISLVLAFTLVGFNPLNSQGNASSSLLQMDIKKAGVSDTVDVTFFTTGDPANTVVTRKSNNKYVVLLPNTSGSSSIVPNLGGVKDLVTNVQIKNVDDGIGGYTKVTFDTTKPINIKTYTKKTDPLSQVQKDYKNVIAKSQSTNFASNTKTTTTPTSKKITTDAQSTSTKKAPQTQLQTSNKIANITPVSMKVQTNNPKQTNATQKDKAIIPANSIKPQEKVANIEKVDNVKDEKISDDKTTLVNNQQQKNVTASSQTANKTNSVKNEDFVFKLKTKLREIKKLLVSKINSQDGKFDFKLLFLAGFGIILLFAMIGKLLRNARASLLEQQEFINNAYGSNRNEFATQDDNIQVQPQNHDSLSDLKNMSWEEKSWQEKYKLFAKQNASESDKKAIKPMSYVANPGSDKSKLLVQQKHQQEDFEIIEENISDYQTQLAQQNETKLHQQRIEKNAQKQTKYIINNTEEDMELKNELIRQPGESNEKIEDKRLRGFSQDKQNKSAMTDSINTSGNRMLKTTSKQTKFNHKAPLEASFDNGEPVTYSTSSLYDYLSIVDEDSKKHIPSRTQNVSNKPKTNVNTTNPIAKKQTSKKGLAIKSGFDIEKNKSIYLVDMSGKSAIVGRINNNIFVLKKFNQHIEGRINVIKDKENSYIVKVANYRSIVNVSKDKMSTLVEI